MKTAGEQHERTEVNIEDGIVVLELFTSQGCSSCPPADELLVKVQREHPSKVYAISYHVDYWNYIGWEDPFSKAIFTARQSEYNRKFKSRSNYTPQLVVNGVEHFVGSDARKLNISIAKYGSLKPENNIEIKEVSRESRLVKIDYRVRGKIEGKRIRAVLVIDKRTTKISRGENRNRKLTNSNIAIAEIRKQLDQSSGNMLLRIPDIAGPDDKISAILLVENEDSDISGASRSPYIY